MALTHVLKEENGEENQLVQVLSKLKLLEKLV